VTLETIDAMTSREFDTWAVYLAMEHEKETGKPWPAMS
jgi:hypothetical protein